MKRARNSDNCPANTVSFRGSMLLSSDELLIISAYHMKCIDPWLTKNRKVCPVCKRKVGPSNGSDSSDSESERGTTTTSMSSSQINPAAIATGNPGSSTRDSVPLLRYEQPVSSSFPSQVCIWRF